MGAREVLFFFLGGIVALDVTVGGASANSYASVAEADAYCGTNLYASGWFSATTPQKENALIMATRLLDGMPAAWTGSAATVIQALGWPRTGMLNRNGYPVPANINPQALKDAQSEYARLLFESNLTASPGSAEATGITSVSAGGVSMTLKESSSSSSGGASSVGASAIPNYGKEDILHAQVPSSVILLLVPSWLLDPRDKDEEFTGLVAEVL